MSDHKAIREALEAIDAPSAAWTSDNHDIWSEGAPFETLISSAEDARDAAYIAACNPAAIRALLADLDAMRGALEKIAKADNGESGCYYTNRANISIARAALKGAEA